MLKLFFDSAISLSFKIISVGLKFVLIYFITNNYGAENYGAYMFAMSLFLLLNTVSRFGFDVYIQKLTAEMLNKNNEKLARYKFLEIASISFLTLLLLSFIIKVYFHFFNKQIGLRVQYIDELIVYAAAYAIYWMMMYYFRGIGRGKVSVFVMEITQPMLAILALLSFKHFNTLEE